MSETKQGQGWTSGPWVATTGFVRAERGGAICTMSRRDENGSGSVLRWAAGTGTIEDGANARLISAAPDLMKALEAMLTLANRDNGKMMADAITDIARAALARAKGTTTTD